MKRRHKPEDALDVGSFPRRTFSAKTVLAVLGMESWRLQKFLTSPQYGLSASGQVGEGVGSRRLFSIEDIYRIGIADHLVRDGFGHKHVATAVQQLEDDDLIPIGDEGEELAALPHVFIGSEESLHVRAVRNQDSIASVTSKTKTSSFYFLDLAAVINPIRERISQIGATRKRGN